ncbi:NAD-dependent protein deacetylase sirtuin-1 [Engraulis encrasicolus]|uniref:NAD-dependent protein deacetylase sirtuin-1 n=1 Tax=Engraulis encrasicolus TaxID=184585 RepID=UPI002FD21BD4
MADGENIVVGAKTRTPESDEPVLKKPRMGISVECGLQIVEKDQGMCRTETEENWAAATPARSAEEVEPAMAVGQATETLGGDNGLLVPQHGENVLGIERTSVPGQDEGLAAHAGPVSGFPLNGFASPDCDDEDDDRSSHASSSDWTPRPQIGSYSFIQQHIMMETDPRTILRDLLPDTVLPPDLDDMTLWQIIINISEPPKRKKRKDINTLDDVVRLLQESKKILVLTGAGVSVSCGIPDFRSRDGIYARLAIDFPDLPDPQAMFDIEYFRRDPRPFFKFAKEIYPGQFQPSPCHKFIAMLDQQGKLLRNYTQNIDTLEQGAGVQRVIQCHGSFATASCLICKYKVDCEIISEDVLNQVVPRCPRCPPDIPLAIMKPDIVFFGENLPEFFHRAMKQDKDEVDLLIVIGSSLKVRPVALIPSSVPHEVPQVLINREQLQHLNFDVELLGDCDVIVNELCHRLGGDFEKLCHTSSRLSEITEKPPRPVLLPTQPTPPLPEEDTAHASPANRTQPAPSAPDQPSQPASASASALAQATLPSQPAPVPAPVQPSQPAPAPEQPTHTNADLASLDETGGTTQTSAATETAAEKIAEPSSNIQSPEGMRTSSHTQDSEDAQKDKALAAKEAARRRCWFNRLCRSPISKRLESSQYLFQAPNHYIFHGAEVYSNSEDESSSSCDSEDSCGSEEGLEEEEEEEEEENGERADGEEGDRREEEGESRGTENTCTPVLEEEKNNKEEEQEEEQEEKEKPSLRDTLPEHQSQQSTTTPQCSSLTHRTAAENVSDNTTNL